MRAGPTVPVTSAHALGQQDARGSTTAGAAGRHVSSGADAVDAGLAPSFGCSVGDELIALRNYFPAALIIGVEAAKGNVTECLTRLEQASVENVSVIRGTDLRAFADESLDVIFAMAVFRHGALSISQPETCRPFLHFDAYDASIADLVRCLRIGGTLIVEHSNFHVLDSSSADMLTCVMERVSDENDATSPYYGSDELLRAAPAVRQVAFRRTR